jgi:hypothetical protein
MKASNYTSALPLDSAPPQHRHLRCADSVCENVCVAFRGRRSYPWWHYAPMQYREDMDVTYCARHKNKCNEGCPYRKPRRRTTPSPLSVTLPGYGDPRFGYGYGMFGYSEGDRDMAGIERGGGLSGPHHHHGGHRRGGMSYYGWSQMPWWYSPVVPQEYSIEETSTCPLHGTRCGPDCPERVTTRRRVPVQAESYGGGFGVLGDELDVRRASSGRGANFGVLQQPRRPFGSLTRRYPQQYGVLGDAPETARKVAKVALCVVAASVVGALLFVK